MYLRCTDKAEYKLDDLFLAPLPQSLQIVTTSADPSARWHNPMVNRSNIGITHVTRTCSTWGTFVEAVYTLS